ncbi:MAG: hypothetical protein NC938_05255 [Candidatus Omnitrophica bacterium]|nr:hypothetical protein [Candidatus Omnitrophota bacterium]MCM8791088.1 hypothetical protein [Candidatus Omnitrophota bacterium]
MIALAIDWNMLSPHGAGFAHLLHGAGFAQGAYGFAQLEQLVLSAAKTGTANDTAITNANTPTPNFFIVIPPF